MKTIEYPIKELISFRMDKNKIWWLRYDITQPLSRKQCREYDYKIDKFSNQKSNELMKYKTAMQVVDYKRDCFDRSIYHGINKNGFVSQIEAFYCTNGETYLRLLPNK